MFGMDYWKKGFLATAIVRYSIFLVFFFNLEKREF